MPENNRFVFMKAIITHKRYWLHQLIGWSLFTFLWHNIDVGGFYLQLSTFANPDFYIDTFLGIGSTHLLRLYIRRKQLVRYTFGMVFIRLWTGIALTAILISLGKGIAAVIEEGGWQPFYQSISSSKDFSPSSLLVIIGFVVVFIWQLVVWAWVIIYFSIKQRSLKRAEQEAENRLHKAELDNLKARLNPHFLFNSLTSIRYLIVEDPQRAQLAVGELADVLRNAMLTEHGQTVALEQEMEVARQYLALEKIRFEERLEVHFDIQPNTLQQQVPPMMVQTLVENAIKHGISTLPEGGSISISTITESPYYHIRIENTGTLADAALHNGFGISGTIKRLLLLYQDKASFSIGNTPRQTVLASIKLPLSI